MTASRDGKPADIGLFMSRGTDVMMSDRSLLAAMLLAEDCIIRGNQSSLAKQRCAAKQP